MSRKAIIAIIILMSTALLGIAVIQWFWIQWQLDLNKQNFESKVTTALNRVKDHLEQEAQLYQKNADIKLGADNPFDSPTGNKILDRVLQSKNYDWQRKITLEEIQKNRMLFQVDFYNNPVYKQSLDKFLKQELADQRIDLEYDYGVFSEENGGLYILNGNYTVPSIEEEASDLEPSQTERSLNNSEFRISLWKPKEYLNLYFPDKSSAIWSGVLPVMISSIIFTGLVLFCFIYTIYVIFRQKKISEITNDFINNMTHEFKTPIATISLAADSINNPSIISTQSKVKRFVSIIKQENKRMLNQVEKVLQMALLEKSDFQLKKTEVDLNQIIEQAYRNAELQVQRREGDISLHLEANPSIIKGDITHISNIINNLLDNANKYSPDAPEISIRSHNVKGGVRVEVEDKGLGLSKESQKHIFDKFYRVHTGNRHDVKGFGLGLSYVKAMMDAHKGNITVESELGRGSKFILTFPY